MSATSNRSRGAEPLINRSHNNQIKIELTSSETIVHQATYDVEGIVSFLNKDSALGGCCIGTCIGLGAVGYQALGLCPAGCGMGEVIGISLAGSAGYACCLCALSGCVARPVAEAMSLTVTNDRVFYSEKLPVCCGICGTNDRERSVPLEQVTSIGQAATCREKLFDMDVIVVQTAGGHLGGDIRAYGLLHSDKTKTAIMQAKADLANRHHQPVMQLAPQAVAIERPAEAPHSKLDQLKQLAELKESGVLTQEEFNAEKAKILAGVVL
jgi:hypothetical protein